MPRPAEGPRLYLRHRSGREPIWVIRDGPHEASTGCREGDLERARAKLGEYLTTQYTPPKTDGRLDQTLIADVMNVYLKEHAPTRPDKGEWLKYMATPIIDWWGEKKLSDVRAKPCTDYVDYRMLEGVSDQTARHELKQMSASIKYFHKNHGPLTAVPEVTLPSKKPPRVEYWLSRKQVAERIRQARRRDKKWKHLARTLIIGVYSGTRPGATRRTRWVPSTAGGWFDIESETYHRAPLGGRQSKKRQPPARIHRRLLPHLKRWKRLDEDEGVTHVIHYYGRPIKRIDNAWQSLAIAAGHAEDLGVDNKGRQFGRYAMVRISAAIQRRPGRCRQGQTPTRRPDI
jgi:hypothetical protein